MRNFFAVLLSMTVMTSGAVAAGDTGLAAGKPAGVKHAQEVSQTAILIIGGIAIAGVAIGLGTASSGNPGGQVALTTVPATTA